MLFVAVLVACPGLAPQSTLAEKLNAPLDFPIVQGDVSALQVSGNGEWIAYTAQQEDPTTGLYIMKRDGSFGPLRVPSPGSPLADFALNHLGNRVLFRTDARTLLMADSGGLLTQLNPPLGADRAIQQFRIAPGGLRAVYLADQEVNNRIDLYSVPLFGPATVVKLEQRVDFFTFSGDGTRVILTRAQANFAHLFSVPINASAPSIQLSAGLPSGSFVKVFDPSPATDANGLRTVFVLNDGGKQRLYSVPTDGSALATQLSGPIVTGGGVTDFRITADGQWIVYRADALVDNRFELFAVPIEGSAPPVAISGARVPLGVFGLGANGEVVFEAERRGRLFGTTLDGLSAPLQLTPSGGDGGTTLGVEEIEITPDGARAVYVVSPSNFFAEELRSVPLDASAPSVLVCPPLNVNQFVRRFELLADGDVLYVAGGYPVSNALYRAHADGSTAPVALHPLGSNLAGTDSDFAIGENDVVFRSDLAASQQIEVFTVPLAGGSAPERLNGELYWTRGFEDVERIGVSADGRHAAYSTSSGIHTLALSTPGIATTAVAQGFEPLLALDFTSDPARFTYTAMTPTGRQLFSAPFDGSASPLQLSAGSWPIPYGVVGHRTVGPWIQFSTSGYFGAEGSYFTRTDGSSTVGLLSGPHAFASELDSAGRFLYRYQAYNPFVLTPTQIFLRDPLAASPFEVAPVAGTRTVQPEARAASSSPDGARVVFIRDQENEQHFELYSVLSVAGALPVKLSGSLPPGGNVAPGFVLAPDGTRIVYAADRDVDGALQLFVSPLDGSAAPLELSPTLTAGESVAVDAAGVPLAWITPDSTRVLFALQGSTRLLLSVPLDGSASAALVGPLPAPGAGLARELGAVAFAPGGASVVFRSARTAPDRFELLAAPVSGGAGLQLTTTPGPLQDVEPGFRVLRNGREVLFRGDLDEDDRQELWLVPVDASRAPRRVSRLGPHDADVEPDFLLADDEAHVYYRADAENDGEIEFFRYPLGTPAVRRR